MEKLFGFRFLQVNIVCKKTKKKSMFAFSSDNVIADGESKGHARLDD